MMGKAFFLFPGQGAQYPEMALDLLDAGDELRRLFSLASDITGRDMEALLRTSSPEELKRTDISQPAITLANIAAAKYLELKGIRACGSAGFSLGEYAALAAAGVISEEDCFFLVTERGKAMQMAVDRIRDSGKETPGMAAVMGLTPPRVEALIAEWAKEGLRDLYAANFNSPKQTAVSGSAAALDKAEKLFLEAGARRVVRLQVGGPFHSPLMKAAADIFAPALEKVGFHDPAIPVFSNVTGKQIQSGVEAKALALRQITESVRWTDVEAAITLHQPEILLEAGPGKVLQGLWKDFASANNTGVPCYAAGTITEINELIKK